MSTISANYSVNTQTSSARAATATDQVTTILRFTYGLVPIVAGADRFMHVLVDWDKYLAPFVANMLPFSAHTFMLIVGVIEMIAGVLVLVKPRLGSIVVSLWLVGIAINLLLTGQYFDVAVRDLVMAIGAYCLFLLSGKHESIRL